MRVINIYKETICDGPGLRYSIYISGCNHRCEGCHNPQSWNENEGVSLTPSFLENILYEINHNHFLDGVTISGGDPFFNPKELFLLLKDIKEKTKKNIWCYTGYTLEYLLKYDEYAKPLMYIDTLVDGKFIKSLYDPSLMFRGSSNQRIINEPYRYVKNRSL